MKTAVFLTFLCLATTAALDPLQNNYVIVVDGNLYSFYQTDLAIANVSQFNYTSGRGQTSYLGTEQRPDGLYLFWTSASGPSGIDIIKLAPNGMISAKSVNVGTNVLDVFPNLEKDLFYVASADGSLKARQYSTLTEVDSIEGPRANISIDSVQLDRRLDMLFYLDCKMDNCSIKRMNRSSGEKRTEIDLNCTYDELEFDFERRQVYATKGSELYRSSIGNYSFTLIHNSSTGAIMSISVSSRMIYVATQNKKSVTMIDKMTSAVNESKAMFSNITVISAFEGPVLMTTSGPKQTTAMWQTQPATTAPPNAVSTPQLSGSATGLITESKRFFLSFTLIVTVTKYLV